MSFKNPSRRAPLGTRWNAYRAHIATWGAGASVFLIAFALPSAAEAFFGINFFTPSEAASNAAPYYNPEEIDLPQAATNPDPNPNKGALAVAITDGSALMGTVGPDGTLPDSVGGISGSDSISSYTVRPGDTLSAIGAMFGVSTNTILWANNLKSSKDIHPGDTLIILPVSGVQHTVTKGETLATLAKKFGGDASEIATFNGLDDGASLAVGSTILIPGGELTAVAAPVVKTTGGKVTGAKSPSVPSLLGGGGKDLSGFWTNPLPGARLTQGIHDANAVDLGKPVGSTIYAAGPGRVIFVSTNGSYNHGWGNDVIIDHGNGTQTLYAHMSKVSATVGETVAGGDVIGAVGMTGDTTGPHLHFEVRGAHNPFASCARLSVCTI